jgi:hypothetical protein
MKGLAAFAEPIVADSVRELAGIGDDRNVLITLDLQAAFDPSGPAVAAPCARLYLVENGKIKTEQVVLPRGYVGQVAGRGYSCAVHLATRRRAGLAGAACRGSFDRPMALPPLLLNGRGAWYWSVSLAVLRRWPLARRVRA